MIHTSIASLIGSTPMLSLEKYCAANQLDARILAKLECFNPGGSVKDRIAAAMVEDAEARGLLGPGSVIIEPTSGNTGIGLAAIAAAKGYKIILTMPETMSVERRNLLAAYGAEIILTEGAKGMVGAIEKAQALHASTSNSWIPGQFGNAQNPAAHYANTGPEIWDATQGQVDIFIAGVGTGGTITGTGEYLKEQSPAIKIIAVEPADSPLLSGGTAGSHMLQGIGANFVPDVLDTSIYDEVIAVTYDDARKASQQLAATQGVLAGVSSGAALHAASQIAARPENAGKTIVVILPDSGERYLSTPLFAK